ncbi:mismatch-specific thymine-DNA glycosylate (mug) [Spizellomyces punctatus DAOM BR117]|uniref:G/T mismatch-specific thymine DNA glycosylase n=1 Tax=Spizellomyces punctatus (strain DAOM BR117) TaxID=645134 RepID=A0A0L0H542_SPIPD|nr:mismatch-specific thymine-DNA glycosylate (mug) [Spizellomyces punctatus DAOM BR117]KNC96036.1 mismatch-specific thymine-DNA glycosylate (mug) [Spizellomyces punctatus DAOM BR117]|eukprot:XP_016604076.1 mismatch-specific thymine-DNA glycosylate (mug) [Spizellomyces punctatus DAOM BR117]
MSMNTEDDNNNNKTIHSEPGFKGLIAGFAYTGPAARASRLKLPVGANVQVDEQYKASSGSARILDKVTSDATKRRTKRSATVLDTSSKRIRAAQTITPLKEVPDYLEKDLDVVFCGFNPGIQSSTRGHHYAGSNNHFWTCLSESGLVGSTVVTYKDDARCPADFSIGFTNIVSRPTRGSSDLSMKEMSAGADPLYAKITTFRPKVCCFVGKGVYEAFSGKKKFELGLQAEKVGATALFVVPSTSGRVSAYSKEDKLLLFKELKRVLDEITASKSLFTEDAILHQPENDLS